MTYVTSKCPHCGRFVRYRERNPSYTIDCPFVPCRHCGEFYIDPYKQEWITKSPIKRFFFLCGNGTWARALLLPLCISALFFGGFLGAMLGIQASVLLIPFFAIGGIPLWLIIECNQKKKAIQKAINLSLARTNDPDYIRILKKAGYKIYPL